MTGPRPGRRTRCGPPTAALRATAPAPTWPCTTARWCGWWRTARRNGCPATSSRRTSCSPGSSGCSRPSTGSTPIAAHASRATPSPASAGRSSTSCVPRTGSPAPSACASARPSACVRELAVRLRRTATEREVADALGVPPSELGAAAAAPVLSVEQLRAGSGGAVLDTLACAEPDPAAAHAGAGDPAAAVVRGRAAR